MSLQDLSLSDWERMADEAARRECETLARSLPHGLKLTSVAMHEYCGRRHRVARFSRREGGDLVHFDLVPGGEVLLGFNFAVGAFAPDHHNVADEHHRLRRVIPLP